MTNAAREFIKRYQRGYAKSSRTALRFASALGFGIVSAANIILAVRDPSAMRIITAVVSLLACALFSVSVVVYLKGKREFKTECLALSEDVFKSFDNAKQLGNRWFAEEHLLFFGKERVHIVKYSDITSAEQRAFAMRFCYSGKVADSPLYDGENPALILAAIKSKSENTEFIINGHTVNLSKGEDK